MSIINIGLSGLNANSVALNVTALNTANAGTVGYVRQKAEFGTQLGSVAVSGYEIGSGVSVTGIRRIMDESANNAVISANIDAGYSSQMLSSLSYLEGILGAEGLNVSDSLGEFFSAINSAGASPSSSPLRQQILQSAESVVRSVSGSYEQMYKTLGNQVETQDVLLRDVNQNLQALASVNEQIASGNATGKDVSSLLDQQGVILNKIAANVDITVLHNDKGQAQVALGSGEPLVVADTFATIGRDLSGGDPFSTDLIVNFGASSIAVGGSVGGGVGGLRDAIEGGLKSAMAVMDELAVHISDSVNAVLVTGFDVNGAPGGPLFSYNPADPASSFSVTGLTTDEIALSSDGNPGNGDLVEDLYAIHSASFMVTGVGSVTLTEAYTMMLGDVGYETAMAISLNDAANVRVQSAQAARDQISAVNTDEEAANLMAYMNAYNANMKVIVAGNELFKSILSAF
ncbi:flagellar hook-associated protein FlgK [Vibrio sp. PNB22_3_1]